MSLVFVSTNEEHVLVPALESALASALARELETVVVDNASTDGSAKTVAARFPHTRIVESGRRHGLSANLNMGVARATLPYVMLCNPDLLFAPDALERLASWLDAHPRAGIVAPRLVGPAGELRASARRWYTLGALLALKGTWSARAPAVRRSIYDDWDMRAAREVDWVPSPALLVRRSAFDEVGRMDERFHLYFTDVDLSLRMHAAGWEVWCEPSARVVHLERRASVVPFSPAWRSHLAALVRFTWKHRGLRPGRGVRKAPPRT